MQTRVPALSCYANEGVRESTHYANDGCVHAMQTRVPALSCYANEGESMLNANEGSWHYHAMLTSKPRSKATGGCMARPRGCAAEARALSGREFKGFIKSVGFISPRGLNPTDYQGMNTVAQFKSGLFHTFLKASIVRSACASSRRTISRCSF
jgi:hypothetical protein